MKATKPLWVIFGLIFCSGLPLIAQTDKQCYRKVPGSEARGHQLDFQKMVLDVAFEPGKGLVKGKVTHFFSPLRKSVDSFFLDAPGITFQEVTLNGKSIDYQTTEKGIALFPDEPLNWETDHKLFMDYQATPRKGIYFIGWNDPKGQSRKQIWTQGQGTDNRHWIPCYDAPNDKLITEVKVTFDEDYQVLSNGERLNVEPAANAKKTWHYKITHPHTTYLVMLAIGKYGIEDRMSNNGTPMKMYYYPDEPEKLEPTYRHSKAIMNILEKETGVQYPWSKYAQVPVQDFLYGAMENTTATIFGDFYHVNEQGALDNSYEYVNAHELAHHWFGDYITLNSDKHIWLHESFATHYGRLCQYHLDGEKAYQVIRERQLQRALSASDKNTRPIMASNAGTNRIYPKGALVLGMLKDVVGKAQFDRVVKHYLNKHAFGHVTTHDFIMAFQEVLGMNLNWFFEQWIKHGGEPHYKVNYQVMEINGNAQTQVRVQQIHKVTDLIGYFRMPIDLVVHYEDGTQTRKTAWIDGPETVVNLEKPKGKSVDFVLFDPNNQVVKRLTFPKPLEELKSQALNAPAMIDRYDALKAMRHLSLTQKRDALITIYEQSDYYFLKKEILRQLAGDRHEESLAVLKKGLNDSHHEVRGAVLSHVDSVPEALIPGYEQALTDSSYDNVEMALQKLVKYHPANRDQYFEKTRDEQGIGHAIQVKWLELATRHKDRNYRGDLVEMTSRSYEFRTRVNAMQALKRLNYCDQALVKNLFHAYLNPNNRLSNPAKEVLTYFMTQHQYEEVIQAYYQSQEWETWEEKQLKKVLG